MRSTILPNVLIALVVSVASSMRFVSETPQQRPVATAEAYGIFVDTPMGSVMKVPRAVVPDSGGMGDADAPGISAAGIVTAENLFSMAVGGVDTDGATAESISTAENVSILNGLITADGVTAVVSSVKHDSVMVSNAEGSQFGNLVVNGVALGEDVAPNTRIDVLGIGTVILNQQIRTGADGQGTGLTVNMISVILKDVLTGAKIGEIVVGSASSYVAQ